jgi:hypothetical protein
MLVPMLLACAVASAGQYASSQGAGPPVYYTPAPAAAAVAPTVLVVAPPFWDRCLARAGAWLSSRAVLHQHPVAATLYVAPARPAAYQLAAAPLASGQAPVGPVGPVWRAESEAVPPPPAFQSSPPPPAPSPFPAAGLTPEQRLSEIRRLLGP